MNNLLRGLTRERTNTISVFGSQKIIMKEKKYIKENDFFMFDYFMKNIKENKI